jgi:type I restriction enzyme S subunit
MTFASYLIRVQYDINVISEFISNYINSPICRETQLEPEIIQQNGQANFNGTKLQNILIPLAPLAEQTCIVAEIEKQLAKTKQLKEHIIANQHATEQLLKALLHGAFEVEEKEEV